MAIDKAIAINSRLPVLISQHNSFWDVTAFFTLKRVWNNDQEIYTSSVFSINGWATNPLLRMK